MTQNQQLVDFHAILVRYLRRKKQNRPAQRSPHLAGTRDSDVAGRIALGRTIVDETRESKLTSLS